MVSPRLFRRRPSRPARASAFARGHVPFLTTASRHARQATPMRPPFCTTRTLHSRNAHGCQVASIPAAHPEDDDADEPPPLASATVTNETTGHRRGAARPMGYAGRLLPLNTCVPARRRIPRAANPLHRASSRCPSGSAATLRRALLPVRSNPLNACTARHTCCPDRTAPGRAHMLWPEAAPRLCTSDLRTLPRSCGKRGAQSGTARSQSAARP